MENQSPGQLANLEADNRSVQAQLHARSQGLEERCNELKEQLTLAEKDKMGSCGSI